ncbi:hypothetical protein Tco_1266331 [Tanacetum coccineum]
MYDDLCLGKKALAERENMGFDLTKSDLCPSFVEDLTAKGMGLHVADSHTGEAFEPEGRVRHYYDDTLKSLEANHPYKPPPSMPSIPFYERPLVAMKGVGKEMSKYLSDFQFGVGVLGDAEAVLHSVNRVLSEYHNDGSLAILTLDFSYAFNLVDRSELLHEDDGTVIGDSEEVARVLDIIKVSGPVHIRRPSLGVKLLGGAVSRDANFISGLAMRRASNAVDLMSLLPQLYDPQTSRAQSWVLQDHILRDSGICGMDGDYVLSLACLRDTISSFDFSGFTHKDTIPFKAQQILANVLLVNLRARISAKKEAPVNFLTDSSDGRSTLKPAGVLVFGWLGGKHACVDLTGVSPLVGLSSRGFTAG